MGGIYLLLGREVRRTPSNRIEAQWQIISPVLVQTRLRHQSHPPSHPYMQATLRSKFSTLPVSALSTRWREVSGCWRVEEGGKTTKCFGGAYQFAFDIVHFGPLRTTPSTLWEITVSAKGPEPPWPCRRNVVAHQLGRKGKNSKPVLRRTLRVREPNHPSLTSLGSGSPSRIPVYRYIERKKRHRTTGKR